LLLPRYFSYFFVFFSFLLFFRVAILNLSILFICLSLSSYNLYVLVSKVLLICLFFLWTG
jgi:hypothetical protein